MTAKAPTPLDAAALCRHCDPAQYKFATTDELDDLTAFLGQDRAVEAIRFAIGIEQEGYNLFVLGPSGVGKHTIVKQFLDEKSSTQPTPADWCYVNRFDTPHRPRALELPAGRGAPFRAAMLKLLDELHTAIPAAFESEDHRTRRQAIEEEFKEHQANVLDEIQKTAQAQNVALIRTPQGLAFAPTLDGEVIEPDDFQKLPELQRKAIQETVEGLEKQLAKAMQGVPKLMRETRENFRALDRETTRFAVGSLIEDLIGDYAEHEEVVAHLRAMEADIVDHVETFGAQAEAAENDGPPGLAAPQVAPAVRRYGVNLLVDNAEARGAPVITEDHPTYANLVGRTEHLAQMGTLITDFNLIKAGALHRANGGYLVLDALKVLLHPYAWEGLKQALRARALRIESPGQAMSLVSTVSLEPEPVPLGVKVVLIGDREIYYRLLSLDPEFADLFKVQADFEDDMGRDKKAHARFAQLVATLARRAKTRALDAGAVARLADRSARLAGDSEKLSTRSRHIADLINEADYFAAEAGEAVIAAAHIQQAVDARERRAGRIRERMTEQILRETVMIDTAGEAVGQINALAVLQVGATAFGKPGRVTARLRLGTGKVIDIEREVELGGPLHSKGVLILSSFLSTRYAADIPFSLQASLVFEQSYGGIDGDSASSTELYALLSALAEAPIRQSLAVTGSVNQNGEVQAIGGVNEKIEGFFELCAARSLSGDQGVLIPAANVKHLMLRRDVIEAAGMGEFAIYPVASIDEGIEILTGVAAGKRDADGVFPEGSINRRVEDRLIAMAEKLRAFGKGKDANGEKTGENGPEEAGS